MEREHVSAWTTEGTVHFRFWAEGRWQKLISSDQAHTWQPAELSEAELHEAEAQKVAEEAAAQDRAVQVHYEEARRQAEAELERWRLKPPWNA